MIQDALEVDHKEHNCKTLPARVFFTNHDQITQLLYHLPLNSLSL